MEDHGLCYKTKHRVLVRPTHLNFGRIGALVEVLLLSLAHPRLFANTGNFRLLRFVAVVDAL